MRKQMTFGVALVAALVWIDAPQLVARGEGDAKAASVMSETRKALGGEARLAAVKALSLRAEFRRELTNGPQSSGAFVVMGGGPGSQMSGTLEIDVLFPDKFYRQEVTSGGLGLTRIDGFEGDRPFLDVTSSMPGARIMADRPGDDPARAKLVLRRSNADLARLLLGLVGTTQPGVPVTYAYAGQAESPDGKAHVIDVSGPEDFKARLFIDTSTHLPLMLTYSDTEPRVVRMMSHGDPASAGTPRTVTGGASGSGSRRVDLTPEEKAELDKQVKAAQDAPPKMLEFRMFFSEYRDVDGLKLPHHISRGTGEKTNEEWDIKSYKVNGTIKADRFKVGTN